MKTNIYRTANPEMNIGVTFTGSAYLFREVPVEEDRMMGQEIKGTVYLLKGETWRKREDENVQREVIEKLVEFGAIPAEGKEEEIKHWLER